MVNGISTRGGWRPGAGRKPGSSAGKLDEKSRVAAALMSNEAADLFERARHGSFAAAASLVSLLKAADRLELLQLDRTEACERLPTNYFWLRRARATTARAAAADLFTGAVADGPGQPA